MIVISEHFDLRLLAWLNPAVPEEDEQPRQPTRADTGSSADDNADSDVWLSASPVAALRLPATGLKVAVVCNRTNEGIIAQLGAPCPERYGERSVQRVAQALRGAGHTVGIFEADMTLLERLRVFLGAGGSSGLGGIVFNMSYGIQGESRYTHVPAMLEMAGVPYTGPGPLGHAVSLDKVVAKVLMRHAGVPTPAFAVMRGGEVGEGDLRFPLVVKPRHESTSNGLHVVGDAEELAEAVEDVRQRYTEDALVETFVSGREFAIGLLGNEPVECLPAVELEYPLGRLRAMTRDDKFHKRPDEPRKVCPPVRARDQLDGLPGGHQLPRLRGAARRLRPRRPGLPHRRDRRRALRRAVPVSGGRAAIGPAGAGRRCRPLNRITRRRAGESNGPHQEFAHEARRGQWIPAAGPPAAAGAPQGGPQRGGAPAALPGGDAPQHRAVAAVARDGSGAEGGRGDRV
ncbi:MAG: D-alanine--D-alanine ligase family protein, partial [Planctomycetota bacterium]